MLSRQVDSRSCPTLQRAHANTPIQAPSNTSISVDWDYCAVRTTTHGCECANTWMDAKGEAMH